MFFSVRQYLRKCNRYEVYEVETLLVGRVCWEVDVHVWSGSESRNRSWIRIRIWIITILPSFQSLVAAEAALRIPVMKEPCLLIKLHELFVIAIQPHCYLFQNHEEKEPFGPGCRDYFWLICHLIDGIAKEDVELSWEQVCS